jgi:hypothetical protein
VHPCYKIYQAAAAAAFGKYFILLRFYLHRSQATSKQLYRRSFPSSAAAFLLLFILCRLFSHIGRERQLPWPPRRAGRLLASPPSAGGRRPPVRLPAESGRRHPPRPPCPSAAH